MAESQQIDDFIVINNVDHITIIDTENTGIIKLPANLLAAFIEKLQSS